MYSVGTHANSKNFNCKGCAERYYNEIGNSTKKYLMNVSRYIILIIIIVIGLLLPALPKGSG